MKTEILAMLQDTEGYISGQEICEKFGVSRTAVWKAINQLKDEGHEIEAVRNRGYHLAQEADVLYADIIRARLKTSLIGRDVRFMHSVDSTNTWAKRLCDEGAVSGLVTTADEQTAGKGRRGRFWETPEKTSLPFSIMLRPTFPPERASMLTLVMGLSVAESIQELFDLEAGIKWPNDVVVKGKKICGILTEMITQVDYVECVIIGTGVNVNIQEFPPELADKATSLMLELGHPVQRLPLLVKILETFEKNYARFCEHMDLGALQEQYNRILLNKDKAVRILQPDHEYEGVALGIDEMGNLLVVRSDTGELEKVYAGEVSVRGLYSYV